MMIPGDDGLGALGNKFQTLKLLWGKSVCWLPVESPENAPRARNLSCSIVDPTPARTAFLTAQRRKTSRKPLSNLTCPLGSSFDIFVPITGPCYIWWTGPPFPQVVAPSPQKKTPLQTVHHPSTVCSCMRSNCVFVCIRSPNIQSSSANRPTGISIANCPRRE